MLPARCHTTMAAPPPRLLAATRQHRRLRPRLRPLLTPPQPFPYRAGTFRVVGTKEKLPGAPRFRGGCAGRCGRRWCARRCLQGRSSPCPAEFAPAPPLPGEGSGDPQPGLGSSSLPLSREGRMEKSPSAARERHGAFPGPQPHPAPSGPRRPGALVKPLLHKVTSTRVTP